MTRKNIMPVAVLTVICLVVAALLGAVNLLTKDVIEENALRKEQESLMDALPEADVFDTVSFSAQDGYPETLKNIYKDRGGAGYVLVMATTTQYSKGDMTISVGINTDGEVVGALLTSYQESKDFGKQTYPQRFIGTTLDTYGDVDLVASVTYSSAAFKSAIGDALTVANALILADSETAAASSSRTAAQPLSASSEEPANIEELFPDQTFTEKTFDTEAAPEHLVALYENSENNTVLAHVVVPGQYVPVASEAFIIFDANGRIDDMKLTKWVVGHDVYPDEDFVKGFLGKYDDTLITTELVSGATGTSADLKASVIEVAKFLSTLDTSNPKKHFPGEEWTAVSFEPADAPSYLTALYKNADGSKRVAHIVVAGEWVPVASEAFVVFDENGRITDMTLTKWIVGHGVYPTDEFVQSFLGRYDETVQFTELVSQATGTSKDLRTAVAQVAAFLAPSLSSDNPKKHYPSEEWTAVEFDKDSAPEHLAALYKSTSSDRMVAHIVVPGEWVPVASEAFVLYNKWGAIVDFTLTKWIVGHGVEPTDSFIKGFVGKNASAVEDVELVSGATGTAGDLRAAVALVSDYLAPEKNSLHVALGITIISAIVLSVATAIALPKIMTSQKRRNKR